jgi:hypothetical protein
VKIEVVDDVIIPDDNKELGVANYYSNQPTEPLPTDEIYVTLTPSNTTLMLGRTLELTAHCFVDGVEDLTKFYLYTITNDDGTTNEYVEKQTLANICTLTAKNVSAYAGKYINIHVNLLGVPTVYYDRKIKLVSLI